MLCLPLLGLHALYYVVVECNFVTAKNNLVIILYKLNPCTKKEDNVHIFIKQRIESRNSTLCVVPGSKACAHFIFRQAIKASAKEASVFVV